MSDQYEKAMKYYSWCLSCPSTHSENQQLYDEWAETYDKDHKLLDCNGPQYIANAVADLFPKHRQDICILDVAAGTGLVGIELQKLGFCNIESLEPNKNMIAIAKRKDVYRKYYEENIPETGNTKIGKDAYDVVVCRGGFGGGALPVNSLSEMLRVTKPGGYVAINTNPKHFDVVPMYVNTIVPLMKNLEESGQWKKVKEENQNNYIAGATGIILVFQKTTQHI
ncbi:methyltransferase-like protein 27 [Mytilus edulis]|uniref:methyltransferase-like protein 27 n=1 Tax=Mytilus edulis TaxID=6550 RepID=UPI0039EDFADB